MGMDKFRSSFNYPSFFNWMFCFFELSVIELESPEIRAFTLMHIMKDVRKGVLQFFLTDKGIQHGVNGFALSVVNNNHEFK